MIVGALVTSCGLALVAVAPAHAGYLTAILMPSVVIGIGSGVFNPPITAIATNIAERTGTASGLANTSKQFGSVLGLSLLTAITTSNRTAFVLIATVTAVTGILAFALPSSPAAREAPNGGGPDGVPDTTTFTVEGQDLNAANK